MITDIGQLIMACTEEIRDRQYQESRKKEFCSYWEDFRQWLENSSFADFSEAAANTYTDEKLGTHLLLPGMSLRAKNQLRAIRMLVSYQKDGDFEFRSPRIEHPLKGVLGNLMSEFIGYAEVTLCRSPATIDSYTRTLSTFNNYLMDRISDPDEISTEMIEGYFSACCGTVSIRHDRANGLRQFFRYAYTHGYTQKDLSFYILPDNYNRHSSIPTTYTEEEIRSVLAGPDRASSTGKRDYLVLLLAAEYGWRSGDITGFRLDQIDWNRNVIRFEQRKTSIPVEYPLLSSIGNAIIDYLKNGRPDSERPEVILQTEKTKYDKPLSSPTVHSIVTRYMKKANISGWKEKKHGAHSLRHSLATNMLKRNVALSVISNVLGHQSTETTKIYLKVDTEKLKSCTLPMPPMVSPYYKKRGD